MDEKQDRTELQVEIAHLRAEVEELQALTHGHTLGQQASDIHYRNLVELAVDAIFMGSPQGNIIGANQSAVTLTGYPLEELLGMNLAVLFSAEECAATPLRYDLLKVGQIIQRERLLTRKDGSTVPIEMNSRQMPDGTYHSFMRDHTERQENKARMLALIRDLEAFTFTVSHDLCTPLSNILLSTEILATRCAKVLDEQGLQVLRLIENSTEDMLALVENLLALARAEQIKPLQEPVDSNAILDKVLAGLSPRLEADGVTIKATPLPALKIPATFISQIFNNLLGNALNYAGASGSRIDVGGERHGTKVRLYVRDYGPGIPAEERRRIFDVFYRGANAGEHSGSGLGLAIVEKIARAFDGQAWVEETAGGGCSFFVEMEGVA